MRRRTQIPAYLVTRRHAVTTLFVALEPARPIREKGGRELATKAPPNRQRTPFVVSHGCGHPRHNRRGISHTVASRVHLTLLTRGIKPHPSTIRDSNVDNAKHRRQELHCNALEMEKD